MAVIRDVMPAFDLLQPTSAADAQKLLEQHGDDAWVMAGGLDSFDWLKDRIKKPKVLVDLSGVDELKGIRTTSDGVEIGAMTTLTDIVNSDVIKGQYGILSEAAELVASPQIRNQGTVGGNVSQDVRCWYYREGWPCYRGGGNICYADTPVGRNREHAIFGANRCVAVHPSDMAPALIVLDAKFVLQTAKGQRVVDAEDYYQGPEIDIMRINILQPGDLLTAIRMPAQWAECEKFYFWKKCARPECVGFPPDECCFGDGDAGQLDRSDSAGGKRRGSAANAPEGRGRCSARQARGRDDGFDGGRYCGKRRGAAAV